MLDRLMSYGKRDKGFDTALITIIVLAMSLAFIAHSGILQDVPDTEHVVGSEVVSQESLLLFRLACVLVVIVTLLGLALDPETVTDYPLDFDLRKDVPREARGIIRMSAFTQWHFALIGGSFAVASAASVIHLSGGVVPDWILVASPILFSMGYSCAFLVTSVISFHIIDDMLSKGQKVGHLFSWYELVMHNGNVAMMGIALILNDLELVWSYFAFPIVFGIVYVAWAAIFANFIGRVFIYDFIDYRKSGAPIIYSLLLGILVAFFFLVLALDRLAEWDRRIAALIVLAITWAISRTSKPDQG